MKKKKKKKEVSFLSRMKRTIIGSKETKKRYVINNHTRKE